MPRNAAPERAWFPHDVSQINPASASMNPVCTGTSVIAIQFDGGVAVAADTLASYGRMARFPNVSRLYSVTDDTLLGIMGDYADYQFLKNHIENKILDLKCGDPEASFSPVAMHAWLTAVLYNRRSKFDPLWNTYIVAGVVGEEKKPYLGSVDKLGVAYTNPYIATGLGAYVIQQSLETKYKEKTVGGSKLTQDDAIAMLSSSLQTLFHLDCFAHNKFEIGVVTAAGTKIFPAARIIGEWSLASRVMGYE